MIQFSPLVPLYLIAGFAIVGALPVALGFFRRVRGSIFRALALAALLLALLNPVYLQQDREPLDSVVAVIVDRSQSQASPDRTRETDETLKKLTDQLARFRGLDVRVAEAGHDGVIGSPSTELFHALSTVLRDVPVSRIAGAVMITDGQVHDVPESADSLGILTSRSTPHSAASATSSPTATWTSGGCSMRL